MVNKSKRNIAQCNAGKLVKNARIGLGFQLKDDLLDAYADPKKFGKQVGGDIIANKKTFLLIKALEKATARYAGPKGNLQFPLSEPIPYKLIERLVKLRVKQDAVPGMGVTISFTPDKTGEFEIACAELCGALHYKMKGQLVVR